MLMLMCFWGSLNGLVGVLGFRLQGLTGVLGFEGSLGFNWGFRVLRL